MRSHSPFGGTAAQQRGLSLLELLVALAIALFLLGGLLTIVQDTRRTSIAQSQLAQVEDSERLAMTMMTDVIQASGYFPCPAANTTTCLTANTAGTVFGADGFFSGTGQVVTGTTGSTPGDTITVRYATASGDGIVNCLGGTNTTGGMVTYENEFSIVDDATNGYELQCTLTTIAGGNATTAAPVPLVGDVSGLVVTYGVATLGTNGTNVDTYMDASTVTQNNDWMNVTSVRITLTFNYQLNGLAATQQATFSRYVDIMNQVGANIT